jgi:hypothetical protein
MAENDPDDLSTLPPQPTPEQLPEAYQLCRKKLARANRSRTALRGHDDYRSSLIDELRVELEQLEASFLEEASERAAVHALNARVLEIVQLLEAPIEEAASIVEEKDKGGLSGWVIRFARLLPVVLKLRETKAATRRLLGRETGPALLPAEPASQPEAELRQEQPATPEPVPPSSAPSTAETAATARPDTAADARRRNAYGPLVLQFTGACFGVLLLPSRNGPHPEGLIPHQDCPLLPGHTVLIPRDHDDPEIGAIDVGFLAIEQELDQAQLQARALVPELHPWLERGLLPFALDPLLHLPRLVHNASVGPISHVLVREAKASVFQEQFGGTGFDVDSDLWLGFQLDADEAGQFWRGLDQPPDRSRQQAPRLSTRGGVAMIDRRGFLATGLGLPLLTAPLVCEVERVQLQLADGLVLDYSRSSKDGDSADRQIWQPSPADRRRVALTEGPARFTGWLADGSSLQRNIQLTAVPERVRFQRVHPIAYREDWGLHLGPLQLPEPSSITASPSPAALQWARQRLNSGDANVNALFEQQMLESLSALFQRRASLQRRDFLRLYAQLRNKPDEWPGFPEAVLRGWCEGGWLEEGVERRSGRWRLQPIDPRLVRLSSGGLQLVGLLSACRLIGVLAAARELGVSVRSVSPSCADMPRGWRFHGDVEALGPACGLPVVETEEWVPDPTTHAWGIEEPLAGDSPPWPHGLKCKPSSVEICGNRGEFHYRPAQPLPEGHRASIHLKIKAETSSYGKRRWHSHDPARDSVFSSCHRNRVALHALALATMRPGLVEEHRGLWPFGFTDSDIGQIDRLYDCEAYLPLPLARWAALTGRTMPGPTRHQPRDHTYRYHVAAALRSHQLRSRFLPLTRTT